MAGKHLETILTGLMPPKQKGAVLAFVVQRNLTNTPCRSSRLYNAPSLQTVVRDATFLLAIESFLLTVKFFYSCVLQLLLMIGSSLLAIEASLLTNEVSFLRWAKSPIANPSVQRTRSTLTGHSVDICGTDTTPTNANRAIPIATQGLRGPNSVFLAFLGENMTANAR